MGSEMCIRDRKGNVEEGLFFCGANVSRLDRMRSVRELMEELMDDWRKHQ